VSGTAAELTLRPASADDEDLLLGWANDPVSRASSRIHEPIPAADHHEWLERRLAAPDDARIWIGEVDGRPVGVVRFERRVPSGVEVSISIAPEARGQGLARPLLDAGVTAARAAFGQVTIRADILPGNEASVRLFTGSGFGPATPDESTPGLMTLELPGG
jgi:RimJ/RimL family protein N-acetyltransferase